MIACAADKLVLGKHSFLGPIDPQIYLSTPLGFRMVPAQAILDQFDLAKKECVEPKKLAAWFPMLSQFGPDLLVQCENVRVMSTQLARTWLETYMFKGLEDRSEKAESVADWLADHKEFKSHGRHLSRADIEEKQLSVERMENDGKLQDLSLSVFHATTHTFSGTVAIKIVENHMGRAFIKQQPASMQIGIEQIPKLVKTPMVN